LTFGSASSSCFSSVLNGRPFRRVHRGDLQFFRRLSARLDELFEQSANREHQRFGFDADLVDFLDRGDVPDKVRFRASDRSPPRPPQPLRDDAGRAVGKLQKLENMRDADRRIEIF
jgi:hypothetical protein